MINTVKGGRAVLKKCNSSVTSEEPSIQQPFVQNPFYRHEIYRLISFIWSPTLEHLSMMLLAKAGFFYVGENDRAQCFECGIILSDWQFGDNPWTRHAIESPNCRFINHIPCGNVPISGGPDLSPPGYDHAARIRRHSLTDTNSVNSYADTFDEKGTSKFPDYTSHEDKLRSSDTQPDTTERTRKGRTAIVGLYYTSKGDQTGFCYSCGLNLCDWKREHDSAQKHVGEFCECKLLDKILRFKQMWTIVSMLSHL